MPGAVITGTRLLGSNRKTRSKTVSTSKQGGRKPSSASTTKKRTTKTVSLVPAHKKSQSMGAAKYFEKQKNLMTTTLLPLLRHDDRASVNNKEFEKETAAILASKSILKAFYATTPHKQERAATLNMKTGTISKILNGQSKSVSVPCSSHSGEIDFHTHPISVYEDLRERIGCDVPSGPDVSYLFKCAKNRPEFILMPYGACLYAITRKFLTKKDAVPVRAVDGYYQAIKLLYYFEAISFKEYVDLFENVDFGKLGKFKKIDPIFKSRDFPETRLVFLYPRYRFAGAAKIKPVPF